MTERQTTERRANGDKTTMSKASRTAAAVERRLLQRLLRRLLRGTCRTEQTADGIRLSGDDARTYPEQLLRQARADGLVSWANGEIAASDAALPYLRRALLDSEDPFADQHRDIVETVVKSEAERQPVRRNLCESPLGTIERLKDRDGNPFLPAEAIAAGERLAADFTRGQLQPRITATWEPRLAGRGKGHAGGGGEVADSAMAARKRFGDAVDAMGPELAGVAVDVCCFYKGLELVERERQWPARSAKLMLRTALLALARHYAPPPARQAPRHRHWGAEDYRPSL